MISRIKTSRAFLFICLLLFPFTFSAYSRISLSGNGLYDSPFISSPEYGVSNYNVTQSVKYDVEINFTLTHKSGPNNYIFKFARLNNRMPNSTDTQWTPPYQESELLYNYATGYSVVNMGHSDQFNNTYDSFNATLGVESQVTLSQHYIIELNDVIFQNVDIADIGTYNMSDKIFDLYCNNSEPYYERDNLTLIALSNSLVEPTDNPIQKAQKIFNWVSSQLTYNGNLPPQEKGALWAYDNLQGDCSEYSSLMITLLRIQGIPARKVTGFLVSNNPALRPQIGNSWNFQVTDSSDNMLGHAWIEYYVPNIGWIACDPTWKENYFNNIDYLRFNLNVGANIFFPPASPVSEFGNPIFVYSLGATYT
ncbi:MAG: transglutaminase-like domain-containing protein, partial [Promethearchaeota archaeon]